MRGGAGLRPGRGWVAPSLIAGLLLAGLRAGAQELEPRAYANLPTGLNFGAVGYAYSEGGLSTDPALPVEDAELEIHTAVFAYVRSLDLGGMSGKFDVVVPYAHLSGTGKLAGVPQSRRVSGLVDPRFRLSVNFHGAPALTLKEYAKHRSDFVVGGSLSVTPPLGQYDADRFINLGSNRWSIKPDVGFSKKAGPFTFDMTLGVMFVTDNDEYVWQTLQQAPIGSTQANLSYDFGRGIWAAVGATYFMGGRTTVDGVRKDTEISNSRVGVTVSFPINRRYSVKFNASSGIVTRIGSSFTTVSTALQYRWGAGL